MLRLAEPAIWGLDKQLVKAALMETHSSHAAASAALQSDEAGPDSADLEKEHGQGQQASAQVSCAVDAHAD